MEKEAILIEAASLSRAKSPQAVNVLLKHSELKLAAVHLLLSQVLIFYHLHNTYLFTLIIILT